MEFAYVESWVPFPLTLVPLTNQQPLYSILCLITGQGVLVSCRSFQTDLMIHTIEKFTTTITTLNTTICHIYSLISVQSSG